MLKDVYEGSLGVSCNVSPTEGAGKTHVICLYTSNYQDRLDALNEGKGNIESKTQD